MMGLMVTLCVAAATAGSASANWEIEGKALSNGQSEEITFEAFEKFDLTTKVAGATLTLTGTSFICFGICSVDQNGVIDDTFGIVRLGGVTVDNPAGCSAGSELTTNKLKGELIMDPGGGEATFLKLVPETGEAFFTIKLSGATCALAGVEVPVKGSITGRLSNTGVSVLEQPITFGSTEQVTGGGSLKVGKEAATLTGKAIAKLSGANVGKKWGGK
jgi:hypothetical protein